MSVASKHFVRPSYRIPPSVLKAAQAGEQSGFQVIMSAYAGLVRYWCRQSNLSLEDTEDVFQNVFLTVFRRLPEFKQSSVDDSLRAWIRVITRSKIVDCVRENSNWKERSRVSRGAITNSIPFVEQPASTIGIRVMGVIREQFSERDARIFERVIFDGAETAIVASEFDVTPNVVYIVMSRILKMLRTMFEPESPFGTMFDECTLVYLSPERFYFDWRKLVAAEMQYRHGFLSRFDSIACGDVIEISRGQYIRNPANVGGKSDWRGNNTFDERLFHLGWETDPLEVLAECLSNGANVNATDHQGLTPLAIALEYRKYHLVEPLLRAGADPNSPNGITLSVACHRVKNDDGIRSVRQLIEAGADVQPCVAALLNEDSNPWVDRLLELVMPQNPDLELRNSYELTGLLVASASGNRDDLKNWIRWGADPQARTPCGATALMLSGHSLDKTRTLISAGLDVNATDDEGRTALIYAAAPTVRDATYSVIDSLLKAGADVTKCDSTGRKAVDYALENEIALRLLDHVRKSWLEEEDANDPFIRALVATETVSYELGRTVAVRLLIEGST